LEIKSENINYKTKDDEIFAHLAYPVQEGRYPGIILIHEIFGLDEHIKKVADRIAGEGYVVLAPHLFSSKKLSVDLSAENIAIAMKFMMSVPPDKQRDWEYRAKELEKQDDKSKAAINVVNQILFLNRPIDLFVEYMSSGVDYLVSLKQVNGKIGSTGFCFGGGMSINLACTGKTDASIIFYGENPDPIDKIKNVKGAVMGLYGGEDQRINSKINELTKALVEYKRAFTIKVFPGAYHAFFNDTRPQTYNKAAAEDSWTMMLKFFKDNLSQ
jgi:carboxymethylenebutenolidase